MKIKVEGRAWRRLAVAALVGVAAGFLNGFLGAGSGVLLMFAIGWLDPRRDSSAARDHFATVVACVLPLSVVSVVIYTMKGAADAEAVGRFALSAIMGGAVGGFLTDRLDPKILRIVFAIIVVVAGVNMAF